MKSSTKLILEALGKIHDYFASLEATDNPKYDYIRCSVYHRNSPDWFLSLDFGTREFFLVSSSYEHRETADGEKEWYRKYDEYRLKYTEKEKETFDEDSYEEFLYISQYLLQNWGTIKKHFLNKYERNKSEGNSFANTLENFEA